jgi:hypothetical protein
MQDTRTEIEAIKHGLGILASRVRVLRFGQSEAEAGAETELIAAEHNIDEACRHLTITASLPLYALESPIICTGAE